MTWASLAHAIAEIWLVTAICVILLVDAFAGQTRRGLTSTLTLVALAIGAALTVFYANVPHRTILFDGMYVADGLAYTLKLFGYVFVAFGLLYSRDYLEERGILRGLISVCSEEVATLWEESAFRGLFEVTVFSCTVGLAKPDPRIYLLACDQLGVEPGEALFVGDGANDELAGAERVGMRAVLIYRAGKTPYWPAALDWPGARVTSLPEVLELV